MARIKGQANYASNFEVLKQAPLDSRTVVSDSGDLIKTATWQDADGNVWLYDGLIVTVPNTNNPSAPEAYILKDKDNYGRPDAWLKLGADNASAVAAIQEALKKKANLANGKVPANELPIVTSLKQDDYTTIPSAKLVDEALTAVGNTLEEKINNKVVGLLHWRGVKDTTDEIKAIAPAKKGDVWHSNGDGSEWVCTQDITAANADAWTELGTPVNLSGYYTKTEVDKKVKPLADSIGTDNDAASANGSLYARIKKNATDISTNTANINATKEKVSGLDTKVTANTDAIATKASNSDLAALQSKVELKANQSDINGALILNLTTASTEAEIRKAFTEVNTKTVLFPTPGSIISKLDGNNKGIVVSLSEPDATTLGRTITVYHGNDTYTIIVKSDFTKVLMPWSKVSPKRNVYSSDIIYATSDLSEADIKSLFTPRAYKKYNIVFPVKPQTGDLVEEAYEEESRFTTIIALRNEKNPTEYTDIFIPVYGIDNRYYRIVLKNDLTSVQSYDSIVFKNYRRCYNGEALLALDTVKAETIENSITDAYVYSVEDTPPGLTEQLPEVGDLIETEGDFVPVCEVFLDSDDVQHTRWFSKGKLYEVTVNTALTRVPEDPKVIYDTTSGTLRDLYISAGAVYNEATGFYELNGLTDITEEEMRVIWQEDLSGWYLKGRTNLTRNISARGDAGGYNGGIDISNICFQNSNITKFNFGTSPYARYLDNAFSGCTKLETIDTRFPIIPFGGVVGPNIFRGCSALKEVRFNMRYLNWSTNVNFPASPLISKDSVLSVIQTTPTTGSVKPLVVVGLNESAYNRLKDDTDIQQALTEKNGFVTLTQI